MKPSSLLAASAAALLLAACSSSTSNDPVGAPGADTGTPSDDGGGDTLLDESGTGDTGISTGDTGISTGDTGISTGDTGTSTGDTGTATGDTGPAPGGPIKTVFLILMENHNWSSIVGSASAPYINGTLIKTGATTSAYYNPPGIHPSEPNYLWLEAGDNFGITDDLSPKTNHQGTKDHLVTQLQGKGISWKSYQEDIDGKSCPLTGVRQYAPKHNPMVYFDDVTGNLSTTSANCIAHVRPYTELAGDLTSGAVGRYNFITPNLCNDMHGASGCPSSDVIASGDTWLSTEVPKLLASAAYKDNGAIFIVWDEGTGGDGPVGMIVLSPKAKPGGYVSSVHFTHGSTLRTMEEIFGVPLLRDAATQTSLQDMFTTFP